MSLDWARRNNLAGSLIMLGCMSDQQELIHNLGNNAKDMWDKLAALYKEQGFNLKYSAILELVNIRYANFTSASGYNSAFKRAQQKIKDYGILSSTDDLFSICFLQGFGDNYEAWVTAKRSVAQKEAPKLDDLMSELIDESRLAFIKKEDSIALTTRGNKGKGKGRIGIKCHHCGKMGHKEIDCFHKHPEKAPSSWKSGKGGAQGKRSEIADNASSISLITRGTDRGGHTSSAMTVRPDTWLVDTGAFDHICNRKESFEDYRPIQFMMGQADGQTRVLKIGTVPLVVLTKDGTPREVKLKRVLHAPKIGYNLVSNRRLRAHGYYFHGSDDTIRRMSDDSELASAPFIERGLHELLLEEPGVHYASRNSPVNVET